MGKNFPLISTLKENPSCFEGALMLIERSFEYSSGNFFKEDFAPLVDESNHHNCYILIDENKNVLAHVGLKERSIKVNEKLFTVFLVGGIAVDEKYRGQGLFQNLFIDAIADKRSDASFFLLWSDQEKLYTKHGFSLCGGQFELEMKGTSKNLTRTKFHSLNEKQINEIKSLYQTSFQKAYLTVERSEVDWDLVSKIRSADLYLEEDDGKIKSYLFANKGQDLEGIVYEYGTRGDLSEWLNQACSIGKVWMGAPLIDADQSFYQFMLCPGDTKLFGEFIFEYTEGLMRLRDINVMKQEVYFDFGGETLMLSSEEFLRGVFGPGPFEELGEIRPFFLSGLDSI